MRGTDEMQEWMFSYVSAEKRARKDRPLRAIRTMVDVIFKEMSPKFESLYSITCRPSIAPEKLLRTLLLQVLYTVRSERLPMEQLDYNLFRWFVGLSIDDKVWDATVFSKNRERLLEGDIAKTFFEHVYSSGNIMIPNCRTSLTQPRRHARRCDPPAHSKTRY